MIMEAMMELAESRYGTLDDMISRNSPQMKACEALDRMLEHIREHSQKTETINFKEMAKKIGLRYPEDLNKFDDILNLYIHFGIKEAQRKGWPDAPFIQLLVCHQEFNSSGFAKHWSRNSANSYIPDKKLDRKTKKYQDRLEKHEDNIRRIFEYDHWPEVIKELKATCISWQVVLEGMREEIADGLFIHRCENNKVSKESRKKNKLEIRALNAPYRKTFVIIGETQVTSVEAGDDAERKEEEAVFNKIFNDSFHFDLWSAEPEAVDDSGQKSPGEKVGDKKDEQEEIDEALQYISFDEAVRRLEAASGMKQEHVSVNSKVWKRSNYIIGLLKILRGFRCQICGCRIKQKNGGYYVEGAHIIGKCTGIGHESPNNILILCPNHHKEFDKGETEIIDKSEESVLFTMNGVRYPRIDLRIDKQKLVKMLERKIVKKNGIKARKP
jgi:hypothetical protein